jgi:hypothetical protein
MARYRQCQQGSRFGVARKCYGSETAGATSTHALDENFLLTAQQTRKMFRQPIFAKRAQSRGALLDERPGELGHAGSRCSWSRAEGKNMQIGKPRIFYKGAGIGRHVLTFGWKAGDQVGAKNGIGPQSSDAITKGDGVVTQMTPLHAL